MKITLKNNRSVFGKGEMRICFLQKPSKNKRRTSDLAVRNKKTGVIDTGHKILKSYTAICCNSKQNT